MKCKYCDGTGEHINDANRMTTCEFCGGTGVIKPLTNEEWFASLSTEEKAEFLKKIIQSCGWCLDGGNPPYCLLSGNKCFFNDGDFVEWLKEKHE